MEAAALRVLIGLIVGTLIGLTGLGGGVLLLPILIFGLGVPAIKAVGSDALFNFITKIPSSAVHLSRGTVRRKVVLALAAGSVPGSILGIRFLMHLRHLYGVGVNDFIKSAIGILLVVVSTLLLLQKRLEAEMANRPPTAKSFAGMAVIGLVAGFLVGMTSVGSGSMIMMLLLPVLQLSAQGDGGNRHCSCRRVDRRGQPAALSIGKRRSSAGRVLARWFHSRRPDRLVPQHAGPGALVAPHPLRNSLDDRSSNADCPAGALINAEKLHPMTYGYFSRNSATALPTPA